MDVAEPRRVFEDEVAEYLGGHDEDAALGVDGDVAGVDADHGVAEAFAEVAELLVGEGLDGCGVDHTPARFHGGLGRVFGHERLAAAGGRGNDERLPFVNGADRFFLERVEGETEVVHDGSRRMEGEGNGKRK